MSHDERSHSVRVLPGLWHKRQGSNLHIWESKSHALDRLAIPLYAGSCSGVPPNQPVTDFQSRLWRVVKAFPLTHNLMVSYLERRTRLELAPPVWKTGVLTVEHQRRMVGFSLRLSHATGNYAPKSRSPYSVRSNRS